MQPQSGQYDFIMNPGKPPKRALINGGGSSMIMRAAMIGGLFVAVIIVVVLFTSLLGGGGNTPKLTTVAQQQNELIRVATFATSTGLEQSSQATKNFAQSCLLSVTSAQQNLLSFLSSHGTKLNTAQLALAKNPATDTALNGAIASSSFDATFKSIMQSQLGSYEAALKSAFGNTKNASERQLLSGDYTSAQLLLQQLNGASD